MLVQPVRVLAEAAVLGTARGLHVRGAPRLGTERAQKRRGMRRARPDFNVVWLQQGTTLRAPIVLELADDLLKGEPHGWREDLDLTG
jgi:hypothetical protein